jgi:hypothetical protein
MVRSARVARSGSLNMLQVMDVEATGLRPRSEEEAVRQTIASLYQFKYHQMSHAHTPMPIVCAQMFLL